MRIRELLSCGRPSISYEFYPPKKLAGFELLYQTLKSLEDLHPTFVSVTYGRDHETRRQTVKLITRLHRDSELVAMAHLTCDNASRDEIHQVVSELSEAGVENILALRGDPADHIMTFEPHPEGFAHADELSAYIRDNFDLCVGGACYPETHPEALNPEEDLFYAKQKVEAGCQFLITQLFFDNEIYFNFVARARAAGIGVPIIPGIMPITNVKQIEHFTDICGASIPPILHKELRDRRNDANAVLALGVAHSTAQCLDLLQRGAPGIHFYTLNKSFATRTILMAIRTAYPPARTPGGSPV